MFNSPGARGCHSRQSTGPCYHIWQRMDQQKTTVYLGADDYRRLKALARARGTTTASLVREAVAEYAAKHARRARPKCVGAGASRSGDIARRAESLLRRMGER